VKDPKNRAKILEILDHKWITMYNPALSELRNNTI